MKHSDLDAVECIEQEAFKSPWSRKMLAGELTGAASHPFSAYIGEKLVGYLFLWYVPDECHLVNIAVAAEYRGKGLGQSLIDFTFDWAGRRSCSNVLLEVRESNRSAIRLYEKNGFQQVGIRKNYYSEGLNAPENAVLMTRPL